MNNDIQKLLAAPGLEATAYPPNSRYHGIETKTATSANGEPVVHLKRRFIPPPESFALLQTYAVVQGDRLDNLAYKYFADPELFWRLVDPNAVMRPETLTETAGRKLRVTLPEGIPGGVDA